MDLSIIYNTINNIIFQLSNFNSIDANDLKLLCHLQYQQNTVYFDEKINDYLTIAFGLIKENTNINNISVKKNIIDNFDDILKNYINTSLLLAYKE